MSYSEKLLEGDEVEQKPLEKTTYLSRTKVCVKLMHFL
jgi:hypothetical protein